MPCASTRASAARARSPPDSEVYSRSPRSATSVSRQGARDRLVVVVLGGRAGPRRTPHAHHVEHLNGNEISMRWSSTERRTASSCTVHPLSGSAIEPDAAPTRRRGRPPGPPGGWTCRRRWARRARSARRGGRPGPRRSGPRDRRSVDADALGLERDLARRRVALAAPTWPSPRQRVASRSTIRPSLRPRSRVRRTSQKKNGPPTSAVSTPSGISWFSIAVRATRSPSDDHERPAEGAGRDEHPVPWPGDDADEVRDDETHEGDDARERDARARPAAR